MTQRSWHMSISFIFGGSRRYTTVQSNFSFEGEMTTPFSLNSCSNDKYSRFRAASIPSASDRLARGNTLSAFFISSASILAKPKGDALLISLRSNLTDRSIKELKSSSPRRGEDFSLEFWDPLRSNLNPLILNLVSLRSNLIPFELIDEGLFSLIYMTRGEK